MNNRKTASITTITPPTILVIGSVLLNLVLAGAIVVISVRTEIDREIIKEGPFAGQSRKELKGLRDTYAKIIKIEKSNLKRLKKLMNKTKPHINENNSLKEAYQILEEAYEKTKESISEFEKIASWF